MAEIRTIRRARKAHDCGTDMACQGRIQPGDRYLLAAQPPTDEDNQTGRWLRMKVCEPCATRWGQTLDEQATPRRRPARRTTRPVRAHRDEPPLSRPVDDVHLPAHDITA
ncbi:hypothetical protein [Micromonospora sp. KC207]|uniref:hypothetical protein n=1 Tax=Micromonospora sp. KC207 TaxID=2530377 RepID=UPI001FB78FC1|nr:hypothetical protein [Micromonospora sp. KC207]